MWNVQLTTPMGPRETGTSSPWGGAAGSSHVWDSFVPVLVSQAHRWLICPSPPSCTPIPMAHVSECILKWCREELLPQPWSHYSDYTAKLSQIPGETKRQNSLWLDIPTGSVCLADVLMHLSRHLRTDTERCKSELQGGDFYLIAASHSRF